MPVTKRNVNSLSKSGSAKLKGDVTLSEGSNITLSQSGNDISIAASGGGGGTPGGADTAIQFNDSGSFGGNANFYFRNDIQAVGASMMGNDSFVLFESQNDDVSAFTTFNMNPNLMYFSQSGGVYSYDSPDGNYTNTLDFIASTSGNAYSFPDLSGTLVLTSGAQTLTDKTLTSPVINSPTGLVKGDVGLGNVDNLQQQPIDADLTAIAGLSPTNDDVIQRKAGAWTNRSMAQVKTDLALVKGDVGLGNVTNDAQLKAADLDTDGTLAANSDTKIPSQKAVKTYADTKQPLDSDLTTIAGLTATTDNFMVATASAWASRTPTQARSQIGLGNVDNTSDASKPISTATQTALDAKVTGPGSATDNAVTKYDSTTGKLVKNSGVIIDASNNTSPATNDGGALGTTSLKWSDLFLADGSVVNFNSGDVTLTHSSNLLTFGGGQFDMNGNNIIGANAYQVATGGALRTATGAGNTLLLQARDVDGAAYTTFATLTANNTPTMDLDDAVTKAGAYIYRAGGTDVPVADGGTGASTLTGIVQGNGTSPMTASTAPTISDFTNMAHDHGDADDGGALVWQALPAGCVVGTAYAELSSTNTTTTQIPNDDTIPQDSEGVSILTCSITPKAATHKLRVTANVLGICNTTGWGAALFHDQDGTANAIAAESKEDVTLGTITLVVEITASNTNAHVFDLRVGRSTGAGTLRWNGSGGRYYSTTPKTSISILEIKA